MPPGELDRAPNDTMGQQLARAGPRSARAGRSSRRPTRSLSGRTCHCPSTRASVSALGPGTMRSVLGRSELARLARGSPSIHGQAQSRGSTLATGTQCVAKPQGTALDAAELRAEQRRRRPENRRHVDPAGSARYARAPAPAREGEVVPAATAWLRPGSSRRPVSRTTPPRSAPASPIVTSSRTARVGRRSSSPGPRRPRRRRPAGWRPRGSTGLPPRRSARRDASSPAAPRPGPSSAAPVRGPRASRQRYEPDAIAGPDQRRLVAGHVPEPRVRPPDQPPAAGRLGRVDGRLGATGRDAARGHARPRDVESGRRSTRDGPR